MTEKARRTRRHDANRRERIAEVAEEPIAERGPEALTHRAITERADVSLSSTTYHFADREALSRAGPERAAQRFAAFVRHWAGQEAVGALADGVMSCPGEGRTAMVVEYRLHAAALRRPGCGRRRACPRTTAEALAPLLGPTATATAAPLMTGLRLHAMNAPRPATRDPRPATRDEILTVLTRALLPLRA
ncbi:TetR family transcriptional regulator [Streptomyces erythrochromogenes]|uniref:TetR family transcriptional regulator n=1 Tax=Streptomyces erythrochromogenes TaxID=285574 RepID=A0ABZ1Q8J3_9ACTN|nr:TetR family transcriptional regulator [Streptomyces erythrochromogenes]